VWWSVVSPFKPYGPLIALIFVVGVAAIKAIIEDRKRHQEDAHLNNSIAHVMEPDGADSWIGCSTRPIRARLQALSTPQRRRSSI